MLCEFEKTIAEFSTTSRLFGPAERILLAVSGGVDSVAMAGTLVRLTEAHFLTAEFIIGHVNHNLRGASADKDEQFVADMAKRLGLRTITRSVDVRRYATENKLSIETAARNLRASALTDIANETGCKTIATAHHKNDNAETIIHRLLRGTGLRGLGGIWPKRDFPASVTFVRPLLGVTRAQIIQYCTANGLDWRHDHTNDDVSFTRNRIRHLLLPELKNRCNGSLVEELASLSQNCRLLHLRVCAQALKVWPLVALESQPDKVILAGSVFCAQTEIIQAELLRRALAAIGSGEQNLKEVHYRQVLELAHGPGGRTIELPGGFLAQAEYDKITFTASKAGGQTGVGLQKNIEIGGETEFADCLITAKVLGAKDCNLDEFKAGKDKNVEWFDIDKLAGPLIVRQRQAGDRFWPLGGEGEKRIGKFLTAAKVPRELRQRLLIITDSEKIIWLGPLRPSELTKITSKTQKILQLQLDQRPFG
jgi:tRNA(Ile)-lysidine synthase